MRDRLIELLNKKYDHFCDQCGVNKDSHYIENLADYLLSNGVIVPPCNVGDKVWEINTENPFEEDLRVIETKVEGFFVGTSIDIHSMDSFGKTVFLTKEEAEKALKGGEG